MSEAEKHTFANRMEGISRREAPRALYKLSNYLYHYYGKRVIILLDEYDTPLQEAYLSGYWNELVSFIRSLFNNTFKTNPYLERAVMTGITRISRESMFSDLNNIKVVTTTSKEYADSFGFTEEEVFHAMDEFGIENKEEVKSWYDGFTFGNLSDLYNPWSITNYLKQKKLAAYWANTSSNSLAGSLLQKGSKNLKMQFERLLLGESIVCKIDEEIVYNQLDQSENAIWSLLLAVGYLKVIGKNEDRYELKLTNYETRTMFERMVTDWFGMEEGNYNDFIHALLSGNMKAMNEYMNRVSSSLFSFFDGGNHPSDRSEPERLASCCDYMGAANGSSLCESTNLQSEADASQFYHGFVLGLLVDLEGKYRVTSNRESGFGRYDVMLEPLDKKDDGIILEFKVYDSEEEADLSDTVRAALQQIEEKRYEQTLLDYGMKAEQIHKYGFAFRGKEVLIGK